MIHLETTDYTTELCVMCGAILIIIGLLISYFKNS